MLNFSIKYFRFFLTFFFFISFCFTANSKLLNKNEIKIIGNNRVPVKTILENLTEKDSFINSTELNIYQKKLFETQFFSNIEFIYKDEVLTIVVKENPLINFIIYEGLENKNELLKELEKFFLIKENQIFSDSKLKDQVNQIKFFLNAKGYLDNFIKYNLFIVDDNKINIFFNIELKNKYKIDKIFFIGDKQFNSSVLKNVISLREHGWWKFLSNTTVPSSDLINRDVSLLKRFYLSEGYNDVQITSTEIIPKENFLADIIFSINSGFKYKLKKITFFDKVNIINKNKKIFQNLENYLKSNEGKVYSPLLVSKINSFLESLIENNNLNITFESNLNKIDNENNFKLELTTKLTDDINYIKFIQIMGNDISEESMIRNNLLFNEGDVYKKNKIDKSIDNLKSLGIFKDVTYNVMTVPNSTNKNIQIKVVEQPTGELSAGAAVGTNGASIAFGIKEKNFLGQGIITSADINIGTESLIGQIDITNPDFLNTGNKVFTSIFSKKDNFDNVGYESKTIGGSIATEHDIYQFVKLKYGFGIDSDKQKSESSASESIKLRDGNYFTTKLYYFFNQDKRDRKYMTKDGYTLGFGQSFATLFSDIPTIQNTITGSYYTPIGEQVGNIKFKIDNITALDNKDVKMSDRLFVGSSNIRGFANRGIGPNIGNDYIGGNNSFYTNFSSTIPTTFPDSWNLIANVFFDVANVWGVDYSDTLSESNTIRSSIGLGMSWSSPIGPVGLTYAQPISKKSTDNVKNFQFTIGSVF